MQAHPSRWRTTESVALRTSTVHRDRAELSRGATTDYEQTAVRGCSRRIERLRARRLARPEARGLKMDAVRRANDRLVSARLLLTTCALHEST
jgi:hypothetical protein